MSLIKIKPFFVLKNKKTGKTYKDVWVSPHYGFLVLNDNDAMEEIADYGEDNDWEWFLEIEDVELGVNFPEEEV